MRGKAKKANSAFQQRLRLFCLLSEKQQNAIARDLGVSRQSLSGYVTGRASPCYDDLIRIAKYFDTSVDFLIGATNDAPEEVREDFMIHALNTIQSVTTVDEFVKWYSTKGW